MTDQTSKIHPYALLLAVLGGLTRLLPHPMNFTPVGGASLFAGARVPGWLAYLLPLLVMAATDPFLGGYSVATPFVYAAFLINVAIGRTLVKSNNPIRIGGAAFLCSLQFFVISNFAMLLSYYPHTIAGVVRCYTEALPFFGRTLAGDLLWTALLFGAHYFLTRTIARNERALATA
jgi:hypothetical protein